MTGSPTLTRVEHAGVVAWSDERWGAVVAFSERGGGVSAPPFSSLDLAAHVGDDPELVDENRRRLLAALELEDDRARLVMAQQVHGDRIAVVDESDAGAGALAAGGKPPIPSTDALVTTATDVPLALCFADCVPVALIAPSGGVAVAHAGWRGALVSIPGSTARALAREAGCGCSDLAAYIGPHIGSCHYQVGPEILSQFCNTFGTVARADSGCLNLDAVVTASLVDAGVAPCSIARLGTCTAEATDRFYSHRAENGRTGRHSALVCLRSRAFSASR